MMAQENIESIKRMQRTIRATQPVCSISVLSRLATTSSASPEIVFSFGKIVPSIRPKNTVAHASETVKRIALLQDSPDCRKRHIWRDQDACARCVRISEHRHSAK